MRTNRKTCPRCEGTGREPTHCVWVYRDEHCKARAPQPDCAKTVNDCRERGNLSRFGGAPGLTRCTKCKGDGAIMEIADDYITTTGERWFIATRGAYILCRDNPDNERHIRNGDILTELRALRAQRDAEITNRQIVEHAKTLNELALSAKIGELETQRDELLAALESLYFHGLSEKAQAVLLKITGEA